MAIETASRLVIGDKDLKLINILREIGYGKVVIRVEDGKPVIIEEIRKTYRL